MLKAKIENSQNKSTGQLAELSITESPKVNPTNPTIPSRPTAAKVKFIQVREH